MIFTTERGADRLNVALAAVTEYAFAMLEDPRSLYRIADRFQP